MPELAPKPGAPPAHHHRSLKDATMRKTLTLTLLLLAATPLLSGCNTTAGAGEDLSAAGRALTNSAEKNQR
jgi:predicted small secreted protein